MVNDFFKFCEDNRKNGLSWNEVASKWNDETRDNMTGNAVRLKYSRHKNDHNRVRLAKRELEKSIDEYKSEKEVDFTTGTISAKTVLHQNVENLTPDELLTALGYKPSEWELKSLKIKTWDQSKKGGGSETLSSVRYIIKPSTKQLTAEEAIEAAKEVFKEAALRKSDFEDDGLLVPEVADNECGDYNNPDWLVENPTGYDDDKLLLINQVELHLGKISESYDTGVEYNTDIALKRMNKIIDEVIDFQDDNKCGNALIVIGGDYFNSEPHGHTFNGTPIQNDHRYKYLFMHGLEAYRRMIDELIDHIPRVDVMLCEGNHARTMEFFLYEALKNYYNDVKKVNFIDDYRATQCFGFGNNSLFFNHGDGDMKRLIASLPGEFNYEWGITNNHYLFIGHFHKSEISNTENGLQWHRIPAPCSNDEWTTRNRFGLGTIPSYQLMIIDITHGLDTSKFIYFPDK